MMTNIQKLYTVNQMISNTINLELSLLYEHSSILLELLKKSKMIYLKVKVCLVGK